MQIKFDDECLLAVKHSAKCFTDMYCLNVFVYFLIRETGERERGGEVLLELKKLNLG